MVVIHGQTNNEYLDLVQVMMALVCVLVLVVSVSVKIKVVQVDKLFCLMKLCISRWLYFLVRYIQTNSEYRYMV